MRVRGSGRWPWVKAAIGGVVGVFFVGYVIGGFLAQRQLDEHGRTVPATVVRTGASNRGFRPTVTVRFADETGADLRAVIAVSSLPSPGASVEVRYAVTDPSNAEVVGNRPFALVDHRSFVGQAFFVAIAVASAASGLSGLRAARRRRRG